MAFELNQPKTIATKQRFEFTNLTINRDGQGKLNAQVNFNVFNEFGQSIGSEGVGFFGEDFNTFWKDFNTGTYIYKQLALKLGISEPTDLESEFSNIVIEQGEQNETVE